MEIDDLPTVQGAGVLLHQLFYNLIQNSIKFKTDVEKPIIKIYGEKEKVKGQLFNKIIVSDNGIGFEPGENEKIFKTFTRLNPRKKYEGTGLGLALCRKIVHRHGGFIKANGSKNAGATFTIFLPENP